MTLQVPFKFVFSPRRVRLIMTAVCVMAVAFTALDPAAHAADGEAAPKLVIDNGHKTFSETLLLADVDLSTPDGERTAQNRIHEAARQLCLRASDAEDRSRRQNYLHCVDASLAAVGPRLEQIASANRQAHALAKN